MKTLRELQTGKRSNYVKLLEDGDVYIIRYKYDTMDKPNEIKTSDHKSARLDFMKIALFILSF